MLRPQIEVNDNDIRHGMRMLMADGVCSQVMGTFVTGAFLVAFALGLGASNVVVGFLAAVAPLSQVLQIPAILLIDRLRWRKAIVVVAAVCSRIFVIVIAATPFLVPQPMQLPVFLASLFAFYAFASLGGCAFNSWVRDLIPDRIMGTYFGRRMAVSMMVGAGLTLAGGFTVDFATRLYPDSLLVYTVLFGVGAASGMLGVTFLARTPEPRMGIAGHEKLRRLLAAPFRDDNYRRLLGFLAVWNFAVNLAAPFGTVYMLNRLGLSLSWVLVLAVFGQLIHAAFFRIWGLLADRLTNKSVLSISGPLFILSFLIWPFTTLPEYYWGTFPLLIAIHALGGMSTAGVVLASGNIALKAAPHGRATSYLAVNALTCGLAATVAPLLAGLVADYLATRELRLELTWARLITDGAEFTLPAFNLRGLDFLFVAAFLVGLYAWHRLLAVREEGEVEEKVVLSELLNEVRRAGRSISNIAGMRHLTHFPYAELAVRRKRRQRAPQPGLRSRGGRY